MRRCIVGSLINSLYLWLEVEVWLLDCVVLDGLLLHLWLLHDHLLLVDDGVVLDAAVTATKQVRQQWAGLSIVVLPQLDVHAAVQ